jgi:hypothetical protein
VHGLFDAHSKDLMKRVNAVLREQRKLLLRR